MAASSRWTRGTRQNTGTEKGQESPRLAVLIVAIMVEAEQMAGRETDVSDEALRNADDDQRDCGCRQ